jgi:hypothetical protein
MISEGNPRPGDLVRLTTARPGVLSVGILIEEKHCHGLGMGSPPTMVIWKVLLPQGVYSHLREEGWKIEVLSAAR